MKKIIKFGLVLISLYCVTLSSCVQTDKLSQKIIDDINSIGEVDLSDEPLIEKIESVYENMTDKQKEQVTNYVDLLNAKDEIEKLHETQDKVRTACYNALELKLIIDNFLSNCDSIGYGMKRYSTQIMNITVYDSVWTVSAVDVKNFNFGDKTKRSWGNTGISNAEIKSTDITSNEWLLSRSLFKSDLGKIENGSIIVLLENGETKCVAFTEGKNAILEEGIDYPKIVDGKFDESFKWGKIDGITKEGLLVGTYPAFTND